VTDSMLILSRVPSTCQTTVSLSALRPFVASFRFLASFSVLALSSRARSGLLTADTARSCPNPQKQADREASRAQAEAAAGAAVDAGAPDAQQRQLAAQRRRGRPSGSKTRSRPEDATEPADSPEEAARRMIEKRKLSTKINYNVLADLFSDDPAPGAGDQEDEEAAPGAVWVDAVKIRRSLVKRADAGLRLTLFMYTGVLLTFQPCVLPSSTACEEGSARRTSTGRLQRHGHGFCMVYLASPRFCGSFDVCLAHGVDGSGGGPSSGPGAVAGRPASPAVRS